MNGNTSPIAFYPNRASQPFRINYRQKEIATICGNDLPPFYIYNVDGDAPETCELYDANTDVKVADLTCSPHLLTHTTTLDGKSVKMWLYQGTQSGIFGDSHKGYYYLKIGSYYSDIFRIGDLPDNYVKLEWQIFDDIITTDGSLISKYVVYKQIFNVPLWHPEYTIEEEGKTNGGIYYPMQQTTRKTSGFSTIVNESQCDVLSLIAPIADSIKITSCLNAQIREMRTNRFEIKSKWQSDDVTHIECEFDLLTIVRKYQKSETAPDPLPIPTPPTPTGNYYIRGTANGNSVTMKINGTSTSVEVFNGSFEYAYDDKLTSFEAHDNNIKTIDFSDSCKLTNVTAFSMRNCQSLTSANMTGCTLTLCVNADGMFANCQALTSLSMPAATFVATLNTTAVQMFAGCTNLTSVSMPAAIIDGNATAMFENCVRLTSVDLRAATFNLATTAERMFRSCRSLPVSGMRFDAATFEACVNWTETFWSCRNLGAFTLSSVFPSFVSAEITTIEGMLAGSGNQAIDITAMDLSHCTNMQSAFVNNLGTIAFDKAHTDNVTNFAFAFAATSNAAMVYLADAKMDSATDIESAFEQYVGLDDGQNYTFNQAFANVTSAKSAFAGQTGGMGSSVMKSISLPNATLASCTDVRNMFANNLILETISAPSLNLPANVNVSGMFSNLSNLKNVTIGVSGSLKQSISFSQSPLLTETAITNIVAWLADLTGQTAKTLTINSTAWSNLPAATQTSLASAISAKNWTLQN